MLQALIAISMIVPIIFLISLIRLIFPSQRSSAKRWLLSSVVALFVCLSAAGLIAWRQGHQDAVALGFNDLADRQEAKKAGIENAALWRARKSEVEAAAARQRAVDERQAAAAKAAAVAKERADADRKAADAKLAAWKEQNCDKDLDCIGKKKIVLANAYCSMAVEQLAKYQSEWTDGFAEQKFPYYRWGGRAGVVTYYGGAIKFQNGFGAWQNMVYECDFDIRRDQPLDVRAEAGRLR